MSKNKRPSPLRFNFGFLLEADLGTSRTIELDYPAIMVADDILLSFLKGQLVVTRTSEGVYVNGRLHSAIQTECVRCLNEMMLPISMQLEELYYYPASAAPEGEQQVFKGDTGFIDLAPVVRELSLLEVPIQPICRPECQGLCKECGQDLNVADCGCEMEEVDPRLAGLKAMLD